MLTQFLVEVSRKPPSTAQPKPKNISWACHCTEVKGAAGAGRTPLKIKAQTMGRIMPARQAREKKGRKPTSQRGGVESGMAKLSGKVVFKQLILATQVVVNLDLSGVEQA